MLVKSQVRQTADAVQGIEQVAEAEREATADAATDAAVAAAGASHSRRGSPGRSSSSSYTPRSPQRASGGARSPGRYSRVVSRGGAAGERSQGAVRPPALPGRGRSQ